MSFQLFSLLHLASVLLLVGVTFAALAAPLPGRRPQMLMWSGILAVLVFISGFGLLGMGRMGVPGWAIAKVACWLALAIMPGLAFRRTAQVVSWTMVTIVAVLLAVGMVVFKPF